MGMPAIDFITLSGTVVLNTDIFNRVFCNHSPVLFAGLKNICFKYGSNRVEEIY